MNNLDVAVSLDGAHGSWPDLGRAWDDHRPGYGRIVTNCGELVRFPESQLLEQLESLLGEVAVDQSPAELDGEGLLRLLAPVVVNDNELWPPQLEWQLTDREGTGVLVRLGLRKALERADWCSKELMWGLVRTLGEVGNFELGEYDTGLQGLVRVVPGKEQSHLAKKLTGDLIEAFLGASAYQRLQLGIGLAKVSMMVKTSRQVVPAVDTHRMTVWEVKSVVDFLEQGRVR